MRSPDRLRTSGDAELVRLVRLGHEPAFEQIYDRHHRGILSFCRHMLGSRDEAEDAVQHTFIAAYRDLRGSDKPIHLKAWLYTIARNRCLSMLRARREQVSIDDVEPATDGLAAEVQRRQDLKDMLRDLHRLPDDQRAALVLSELGALSHEEIAMTLDVRKEKVKALVFQARESLSNSRQARNADCREIQKQLSILRGGSLRRTQLRRHVDQCPACQAYKDEVQRQRAAMAIILPVVPSAGLKSGVLGGALSAGAAGAGGGAGIVASGVTTKLIVGALLAGAGVGGGLMAIDDLRSPPSSAADEQQRQERQHGALALGQNYARDRDGRPADGSAARVVSALRQRARTVAVQRDTDLRVAKGRPVWGNAIAGDRTGPDPAVVVSIVTIALDDLAGGGTTTSDDTDAHKGKKGHGGKGHGRPKKAKKPKIHQGLGAQGKGHGYGRGREPAASAGNRGDGGSGPGPANGRGHGPKAKHESPGAAPAPKSHGNARSHGGGQSRGGPKRSGAGNGGQGAKPRKRSAPAPATAPAPAASGGEGHGNGQAKANGGGNGNGGKPPAPVEGGDKAAKDTVDGAKDAVDKALPKVLGRR
jgi:RNA polymerase sigma factor (sigma-70 family)